MWNRDSAAGLMEASGAAVKGVVSWRTAAATVVRRRRRAVVKRWSLVVVVMGWDLVWGGAWGVR